MSAKRQIVEEQFMKNDTRTLLEEQHQIQNKYKNTRIKTDDQPGLFYRITGVSVPQTDLLETDWGWWVIGSGSSSDSSSSQSFSDIGLLDPSVDSASGLISTSGSDSRSGSSCKGEEDLNSSTGVSVCSSASCSSGRNSLGEGAWHLWIHKHTI